LHVHHAGSYAEEAEKLSLASQEGQIVLALRGLGDDATTMTIGSTSEICWRSRPRHAKLPVALLLLRRLINIEWSIHGSIECVNSKWEGESS